MRLDGGTSSEASALGGEVRMPALISSIRSAKKQGSVRFASNQKKLTSSHGELVAIESAIGIDIGEIPDGFQHRYIDSGLHQRLLGGHTGELLLGVQLAGEEFVVITRFGGGGHEP